MPFDLGNMMQQVANLTQEEAVSVRNPGQTNSDRERWQGTCPPVQNLHVEATTVINRSRLVCAGKLMTASVTPAAVH